MNAHRTLTAALLTATALMAGSAPASALQTDDFGTPTTERERGIVLECRGEADGLEVYASLYENDRYGNVLQVILGDPDAGNGRSKDVERPFLKDDKVRGTITVDGTHRRIATDLVLGYAGVRVPLTCDPAFRYDLMVTKEQIA